MSRQVSEAIAETDTVQTPVADDDGDDVDLVIAPTTVVSTTQPAPNDGDRDGDDEDATASTADPAATAATTTTTTIATEAGATVPASTSAPTEADCESIPEICIEEGEDVSGQDLRSSVFFGAELDGVNFANSNLNDADFSKATAIRANFSGATLKDAVIVGADLTGADFSNADLTDAFLLDSTLIRVTWDNTTCPDGTNSSDHADTCEGNL